MANLAQTAQMVAYLVEKYPEKLLNDIKDKDGVVTEVGILGLLSLPAIDMNTAIWYASEQGWIAEPNKATGEMKFLKKPATWNFGPEIAQLEKLLVYAFEKLNGREQDLEEFFVGQWTMGYPARDVLIAVKHLLDTNKLHEYQLEDGAEKYIFYTLPKNADKLWGRKQFKKDPLAEAKRGKTTEEE